MNPRRASLRAKPKLARLKNSSCETGYFTPSSSPYMSHDPEVFSMSCMCASRRGARWVSKSLASRAMGFGRARNIHAQLTFRSKYFPSSPYLAEVTVLLVLPPQALLPVTGALTVTLAPTKLVLVMVTPFAPCIMNPHSLSLSLELSNHFALLQLSPRLISCALGPIGSRDLGPRKTNLALSTSSRSFPQHFHTENSFSFFFKAPHWG